MNQAVRVGLRGGRIAVAGAGSTLILLACFSYAQTYAQTASSIAAVDSSAGPEPLNTILSKLDSGDTKGAERLLVENRSKMKDQLEGLLGKIDRDFDALGLYGATSYKFGPGYKPLAETNRRYLKVFEFYRRQSGDDALYKRFEARRLRVEGADYTDHGEIACGEKLDWEQAQSLYQLGMERLQAAFTLAHGLNDLRVMASAKNNMGSALIRLGRPGEAIRAYSEGLRYADEMQGDLYKGLLRLNLGNAYVWIGDSEQSLVYTRRALDIFKKMGRGTWEANALLTIGNAYLREQKLSDAWETLRLALEVAKRSGENRVRGRALLNLGMAGLQLKRTDALPLVQEALNWYEQDTGKEVYVPIEREAVRQDGARLLEQIARQDGNTGLAEKYTKQYLEALGPDPDRYQALRASPCFAIYQARPRAENLSVSIPSSGKR